jgi:hypothetical protein
MSIACALHAFVDDGLSRADGLIEPTRDAVVAALREHGSGERAQSERKHLRELVEALQRAERLALLEDLIASGACNRPITRKAGNGWSRCCRARCSACARAWRCASRRCGPGNAA